jgi:hypothetical protein
MYSTPQGIATTTRVGYLHDDRDPDVRAVILRSGGTDPRWFWEMDTLEDLPAARSGEFFDKDSCVIDARAAMERRVMRSAPKEGATRPQVYASALGSTCEVCGVRPSAATGNFHSVGKVELCWECVTALSYDLARFIHETNLEVSR